jgi:glycosyltransferase involved in cell wall biosynthesis
VTVPTKVLEVELSEPEADQQAPDHTRAKVLVRLHGVPLGFLELPVVDGRITRSAVLAGAASNLDLAGHLTADGISDAQQAGQDWVCQAPGPQAAPTALSVVLCTRDRADSLRLALESVLTAAGADVDIVVVDNAPRTAATRTVVDELADDRVRYLLEPRPGLSVARNTGAAAATGDVIAFTDDDVLVDVHWLEGLVRGFTRSARIGCVTGLVPSAELETAPQHFFDAKVHWSSSTTQRLFDLLDHRGDSMLYPYACGMVGTGANFAVSRVAYDDLGGFDEALGAGALTRGGEDLDWFVRTLTRGWTIAYEPSAVVWHRHRRDLESLSEQLYGYGTGLTAYLAKHALTGRGFRQLARSVVGGVRYSHGRHTESVDAGIDRALLRRERRGMLNGPLLYLRARRRAAQARR